MLPLTLLCESKLVALLAGSNGLALAISDLATQNGANVPAIAASNIVASSASADICDQNMQLSYPRVTVTSGSLRNQRRDKFCSLSGAVEMIADIVSSGNMILDAESWAHYYADAICTVLSANAGDWGDGVYYPGLYDLRFGAVKAGGFGFVQTAQISFALSVSRA